jgi:hypothetical protein
MKEESYLSIAARLLGLPPDQLWDYQEGRDGISFRTLDGYRHRYTFIELESDQMGSTRHRGMEVYPFDRGRPDPGGF